MLLGLTVYRKSQRISSCKALKELFFLIVNGVGNLFSFKMLPDGAEGESAGLMKGKETNLLSCKTWKDVHVLYIQCIAVVFGRPPQCERVELG